MNLKDKTILVTGGSSGIGYALTQILITKGAQVICFDKAAPQKPINQVQYLSVDITNADQIKSAFSQLNQPIDILVNNAGVVRRGKIFESSKEDFDLIFGVNLKGSWLILKQAVQQLGQNPTIVQIASRHGIYLPQDPALYAISKAAVIAMTEIVKKTYPEINVKLVCPGPIDTPLARLDMSPEALAEKVKIWITPENFAQKIIELLEMDKDKLLYDQEKVSYYFE